MHSVCAIVGATDARTQEKGMYVITGGATGIGQALALTLVAQKKSVLIIGRTTERLIKTAQLSDQIQYCVADVSTAIGREIICKKLKKNKN